MKTEAIEHQIEVYRGYAATYPEGSAEREDCTEAADQMEDELEAIEAALAAKKSENGSMRSELTRLFGTVKPHHGMTWFGSMLAEIGKALAAKDAALKTAIDAIRSTAADTFGAVPDTPLNEGWWIRDELVDRLSCALAPPTGNALKAHDV